MFAIVKTGGKQYTVKIGDVLKVEKLDVDAGSTVEIKDVLAVATEQDLVLGNPVVENAKVEVEVLEHGRDKKILVFKKKRRKDYKKRYGHRQYFTKIKVKDIKVG
ncbi:50S ribosomal protein L21 [Deferribacter desulfuricans SSM1]|uniref:Large ribosomal subunit protein bL21 n=1 Tax=Deferribacter desulfuricans (strain DSM 14783 / JCM 11476 / NBRC 101012 / SSM1) TaxID=639282 RepID=D3PB00_DEFDS|nr:50S ribosomal protein L21 [Deferribacter desulfuricans]BAI79773.1 50S ribosomal protein L21 [Deferribacter desulfuricans SSM1]